MNSLLIFCTSALVLIVVTQGTPAINTNENMIPLPNRNKLEEGFMRKLNTKCTQRDSSSCMMLKMIVYMNRIFKKSIIDINENIRVIENRDMSEIPDDPEDDVLLARSIDSDEETLGLLVATKLWKFLRSRSMRYKFSDNADFVMSSEPRGNLNFGVSISPVDALEEGRGKMKGMMPALMVLAAKLGVVGAILLKGLFLLAGKALIVSKIALVLSVIIALKKLLSKKHVVEVPHHDTYNSGWARALDGFLEGVAETVPSEMIAQKAHDMAYAGQVVSTDTKH